MLLAIFLGFKSFASIEEFWTVVTTTPEGMGFLAVGTGVGAFISWVLFCTTVVAIPLLLDRELDLITGIIYSFKSVLQNPVPMIGFGILVVALTFVAFAPMFLGCSSCCRCWGMPRGTCTRRWWRRSDSSLDVHNSPSPGLTGRSSLVDAKRMPRSSRGKVTSFGLAL